MKLLNIFGLKNFRIFDDINGFIEELSPINLLTGANNSGKSSVIKALQMIKNSVEQNHIPFDLNFTKQEHLLGDINNVLNKKENKNIIISLPFPLFGIENIYINMTFEVPSQKNIYTAKIRKIEIKDKEDDITIFLFNYRVATEEEIKISKDKFEQEKQEYDELNKNNKIDSIFTTKHFFNFPRIENELIAFVDWEINKDKLIKYLTELKDFYKIYLDKGWEKEPLLKLDKKFEEDGFIPSVFINSFKNKLDIAVWENFINQERANGNNIITGAEEVGEIDFETDVPYYPRIPVENVFYYKILEIFRKKIEWNDKEEGKRSNYSIIEGVFQNQWKNLLVTLSSINYLSNIREENSRIYNASNNTPFIKLLKEFNTSEWSVKQFITKYLKTFEIGKELNINHIPNYQLINVSVTTLDDKKRELVDFGYGIKQLIIILIQIGVLAAKNKRMIEGYNDEGEYTYDYYEPSSLLIEEPETNLHPKWQSLLADMFVEANKNFNIQFIIETHSEYLIRKFQTLVANNNINGENIKIFYLRNSLNIYDDNKQIESLNIQEDGSINYNVFDKGFFDESYNLQLSLLNIQRDTFIKEFEELKQNNDENENKITELEMKIDNYVNKSDIGVYEKIINLSFNTAKLLSYSIRYLVSGQYLLSNIHISSDFSPVIIQYGRAVENELKDIFIAIGITDTKRLMLGKFQGALEKFTTGTTMQNTFSIIELSPLPAEMSNRFIDPLSLKIELLDDIRENRNDAGHSGQTKTKQDAIDYINMVNVFLEKWISEKK
jgi:AAA15 family ATPase/GTPase